ncbi:hypothetical protein F4604DRAFT_1876909 [Suillus subluteus]|nr:hypothetical protein F4604DRAFT_1876909 [Suillus subluteus]
MKALNGARGDDSASLKRSVAEWLMERTPAPNPAIHKQDKSGRGFYNDMTGGLLCPCSSLHSKTYHPDYRITACSWPSFLYEDGGYDPQNPTKGLLKGKLLVKFYRRTTYRLRLSSAHNRNSGERRTRRDVATLLDMRSVQPRAIAYVSVQRAQLRFALSSSGSWRIIDDEFNNQEFYDNIKQLKEIDDLLLWWNQ